MCQLPEFKQFPLYHPSMTFSQVIPKLSSRGRDLLQVILYTIVLNPNKRATRPIYTPQYDPRYPKVDYIFFDFSIYLFAIQLIACLLTNRWSTNTSRT